MQQTDDEKADSSIGTSEGHWIMTYPLYFAEERSRTDGRRVSRALAVPAPEAAEIFRVCRENLRLVAVLEGDKKHPREFFVTGRVKVRFPEQPTEVNGSTPTARRKALLRAIAEALQQERRTRSVTADSHRGQKAGKVSSSGSAAGKATATSGGASVASARRRQKRRGNTS